MSKTHVALAGAILTGCSDYEINKQVDPDGQRPAIEVTPPELVFGELGPGEVGDDVFTIASVGTVNLTLGEIRVTGEGTDAYTLTSSAAPGTVLAPGESLDVVVSYSPLGLNDEALVLIGSDDPVRSESLVQLLGAGLYPQLTIEPNPVDFGYTEPGVTLVETVNLVNSGGATLDIESAVVLGESFSMDVAGFAPVSLEPGEFTTVDVSFAPPIESVWAGEIWVASNASNATAGSTKGTLLGTSVQQPVAVCSVTPEEAYALHDSITWVGRDSYDPSGADIVSWEWSLVSKPDGSTAGMPAGDADRSPFIADLVGEYTAQLVVTNEAGTSSEPCYATVEAVPAEDLWVEMFWTHSGDDMDLHLLGPGSGGLDSSNDCHWRNCVGRGLDWGVPGDSDDDPSLDNDDIPGTGTENINIRQPEDAVYQVYVHDYPGSVYNSGNDTTVRVYLSGELVYEDTKTITGENDFILFATIDWPTRSVAAH